MNPQSSKIETSPVRMLIIGHEGNPLADIHVNRMGISPEPVSHGGADVEPGARQCYAEQLEQDARGKFVAWREQELRYERFVRAFLWVLILVGVGAALWALVLLGGVK